MYYRRIPRSTIPDFRAQKYYLHTLTQTHVPVFMYYVSTREITDIKY